MASAEFCQSTLYTDSYVCDDGSTVNSNGCCAATNSCPSSCMSWGTSSNGVTTTCTCNNCNYGMKLTMTQDERYLKAHNYFRCRHGQNMLSWDATVAGNAQTWSNTCPSQGSNPPHSDSYNNNPSSGENVAAGYRSPEKAVEAWYNEISDYNNPSPGQSSGVTGHYTALIWASTSKLGCAQKACTSGTPAPVHVCQYADSPPNMQGAYASNVPQSNTAAATESSCCATVYGGSSSGTQSTTSRGWNIAMASARATLCLVVWHMTTV